MMLQEVKRMSGSETWRVSRKKMYAFVIRRQRMQKSKKEKQFGTLCTHGIEIREHSRPQVIPSKL